MLSEVRSVAQGFHREVCDQLDRASLSSLLNTAEGNGKRQGKQRAKFFDDARGSAVECAACLDALAAKTLVTKARIAEGKALLLRIVGMLTKLVERFDAYRAREGEEADEEFQSCSSLVLVVVLEPLTRSRTSTRRTGSCKRR